MKYTIVNYKTYKITDNEYRQQITCIRYKNNNLHELPAQRMYTSQHLLATLVLPLSFSNKHPN